jgi:hypothetical protein
MRKGVERRLIVYAKRPLPNHAKTRLGAGIGKQQAAGVYARLLYGFLLDLLEADWEDTCIELAVAAPADVLFFAEAFPELLVRSQVAGDLGTRIAASFAQAFAAGVESVVLTGSDAPDLDSRIVRAAFETLESARGVIGPATDGGYYLLGMRAPGAHLFDDIAWSTERVLAQTEALARAQGMRLVHLPELDDVDAKEEFAKWRSTLPARRPCGSQTA